jgi:hypothetical protein
MENTRVKITMRFVTAVALILTPMIWMIGFASHKAFWSPELNPIEAFTAREYLNSFGDPSYSFSHGIIYLTLPLMIVVVLYLTHLLIEDKPWLALTGGALAFIGIIFMAGVFATWLSYTSLATVPQDQQEGILPAVDALTAMEGWLLITSVLSVLTFVGLMVLSTGLYLSRKTYRRSAVMLFVGSLVILVFMDVDKLMFVGAFAMLVGFVPMSQKLIREAKQLKQTSTQ